MNTPSSRLAKLKSQIEQIKDDATRNKLLEQASLAESIAEDSWKLHDVGHTDNPYATNHKEPKNLAYEASITILDKKSADYGKTLSFSLSFRENDDLIHGFTADLEGNTAKNNRLNQLYNLSIGKTPMEISTSNYRGMSPDGIGKKEQTELLGELGELLDGTRPKRPQAQKKEILAKAESTLFNNPEYMQRESTHIDATFLGSSIMVGQVKTHDFQQQDSSTGRIVLHRKSTSDRIITNAEGHTIEFQHSNYTKSNDQGQVSESDEITTLKLEGNTITREKTGEPTKHGKMPRIPNIELCLDHEIYCTEPTATNSNTPQAAKQSASTKTKHDELHM